MISNKYFIINSQRYYTNYFFNLEKKSIFYKSI